MELPQYNFSALNETDVREEIISPLLRYLGYRSGTPNNIVREQPLSYPKSFLGRKKNTDPILRGRADYICEAAGRVRWVIEAKSPDAPLDRDTHEQAWAYANHPEVRAVYFCLCNGRELRIYQPHLTPESDALFVCTYDDMASVLPTISNILSPEAILRDHPSVQIDAGIPIGPGLHSIVRITHGSIEYHENSLNLAPMIGMIMAITEGSVERNESGKLEAYIETLVPYRSLQQLNEKLGLHSLRLVSDSERISVIPENPTVFTSTTRHILPQGEMVLDLTTWKETPFPLNMQVETQTRAVGYLMEHTFQGGFDALLTYTEIGLQVGLRGSFRVHLA